MGRAISLTIVLVLITTLVGCSQEPPETKAIRLAKESNVLKNGRSTERVISDLMDERKSELKPIGWKVEKESDKIFIVSYLYKIYSFKEGAGERGFFFEVDLSNDSVKDVTKEHVAKMKPLSPVYTQEKQMVDKFMSEGESIDEGP